MSKSYPSLYLLTSSNPYSGCISPHLEIEKSQITTIEQFPLRLTLRFNEQEKSLLNGELKFGIKGGQLTLTVENSQIIQPQVSLNNIYQLVRASDTAVTWQYIPQTGQSILKADLVSHLGDLLITTKPVAITLKYAALPSDISITDVDGLWRHDIHPNKHSILERKLAQFLWKLRLSSHLCLLTFSSEPKSPEQVADSSITAIEPQILSHLRQQLDNLYKIKTNNLLELANLAELDPLKDLAGGNFLGTELSGIALSGANLTQSNFRGANLTDADLSEATLNYTRFSGADLSGAYLGNANLQQSDFYRASLALANLIGANLTDANLQDVNLSQANLSGAGVKGAKFGNNIGITQEMRENLQERGAIFLGDS